MRLVTEQVSVLVRDELKLAELEMGDKAKQTGKGAGMLGGGGVVALYGVACLVACVIIAISHSLQAWLSALIVGTALLAVAGVLAALGRSRIRKATPPLGRRRPSTASRPTWRRSRKGRTGDGE